MNFVWCARPVRRDTRSATCFVEVVVAAGQMCAADTSAFDVGMQIAKYSPHFLARSADITQRSGCSDVGICSVAMQFVQSTPPRQQTATREALQRNVANRQQAALLQHERLGALTISHESWQEQEKHRRDHAEALAEC